MARERAKCFRLNQLAEAGLVLEHSYFFRLLEI
jgi:hypothetical protein